MSNLMATMGKKLLRVLLRKKTQNRRHFRLSGMTDDKSVKSRALFFTDATQIFAMIRDY